MDFWKKLTYKNKLIIITSGFFIVLLIVNSLAISETRLNIKEFKKIKEKLKTIESTPSQINQIEEKLIQINQLIGTQYNENIDEQEILLERVSNYCNSKNIILKEFPNVNINKFNEYIIEYYTFTVEGPFIQLLKLIYSLETNFTFGKISSVEFRTYRNIRLKTDVLQLTIYIQNIKNSKS